MKNYKDLYDKYKIKYLNLKNSIGGKFIYNNGKIESRQKYLTTELHLTQLGKNNLELMKTKVSNFIEKYKSLNLGTVPFESQYNIKGCPIPSKIRVDKNITNVKNLSLTGGHQLINDKSIFDMCSIATNLEQVVQNPEPLFISYYDERAPINNINLERLNYLGYFSLPFYYEKDKMFYVFLLFEKNGIIQIFRPNGKYLCPNTFCEYKNFFEYQLDYLKYFSTNSSVYTYKFQNLILFSHYSLEEMKQLLLRPDLPTNFKDNIIPHLIDGIIHDFKFVSNTDFIIKHFEILKKNVNKKKFITRPDSPFNNKFIDGIVPDLHTLLSECKSYSSLGNIKFFFIDLDACIGLINAKISDPAKYVSREILDEHIQKLKDILQEKEFININHDDDIKTSGSYWSKMIEQTSLEKKETIDKFFRERNTLLREPDKQEDYKKLFKVKNIDEIFELYSSSVDYCNSIDRPLLYSNKDYTSAIEDDITQIQPFLPDLIEKTIEYKTTPTDTIKSNILARRIFVIATSNHHKTENEFKNQEYISLITGETELISNSKQFLYFPFWTISDRHVINSQLRWNLLYNKIIIQCNEFKDMIFPFVIIFDNSISRYKITEPEKIIFLGYFQIYFKTKNNNKILHTYYIFYHLEKSHLEIVSEYGNQIRINQSLSDKMTITYVEIFMIYYENREKHFYCHPTKEGHYFFSKLSLTEIKKTIKEKFSEEKIKNLSSAEQKYINEIVIPFFDQLEEYEMIMTDTKNINFIKKE
jgi:hypothetical protein